MKLKKNLAVFAALALSAAAAAADPVLSFAFASPQDSIGTGSYSQKFTFSLTQGANFFGEVDAKSSVFGNITVGSVLLSNGTQQYLFQSSGNGTLFDSITDSILPITKNGRTIGTDYVRSYGWDAVYLSAGDWTVTVTGTDIDSKNGGSFALSLVDPPANVPEPQTLALAAAALGALVFASRRRANR